MSNQSTIAVDPAAVRAIVAEVLRRLRADAGPGQAGSKPAPASDRIAGRVISLVMIEKLPAGTGRVTVEVAAVVTPSARDYAREKGIVIDRALAAGEQQPAARGPFLVAHAGCGEDAATRAAAIVRGVPGATQLPASGLDDVVAAFAIQASRDGARGVLLAGKPAVATVLANRSASLRAVTARDPAALAAAAAECGANLLVVDPAAFPAAALVRLATDLAMRSAADVPTSLAAPPAGCGCKGH